jgi:hypothetical protein
MTVAAGATIDATDITNLQAYTTGKPLVRLVAQSAQSLADNVATAITFGASSEDIDTHGFHDTTTNPSRITPNVAGYYRAVAAAVFEAQTTAVVSQTYVRKNGSTNMAAAGRTAPGTQAFSLMASVIVSCNGTTDYVEMVMQQDSAGADNTNASVFLSSTFELEFLRPL